MDFDKLKIKMRRNGTIIYHQRKKLETIKRKWKESNAQIGIQHFQSMIVKQYLKTKQRKETKETKTNSKEQKKSSQKKNKSEDARKARECF